MDVIEPANVRNYMIAGSKHGNGVAPANPTARQHFDTTVDAMPALRALWVALDKWVSSNAPPPASKVPSVNRDTAVLVPTGGGDAAINILGIGKVPRTDLDFPDLPTDLMSVFSGLVTVRPYWNFGPRYAEGILDTIPGVATGNYYQISVPKVDPITGNEIDGIILPEITAPLGTNAGWNLRSANYGGNADGTDGGEADGLFIPFALTDAMKRPGDIRPSLEELYGQGGGTQADWKNEWLAQRAAAAQALYLEGFLLEKDRDNYTTSGNLDFTVGPNQHYTNMYQYTW
jgi:hypothetical protein